jgi:hypothetical protein
VVGRRGVVPNRARPPQEPRTSVDSHMWPGSVSAVHDEFREVPVRYLPTSGACRRAAGVLPVSRLVRRAPAAQASKEPACVRRSGRRGKMMRKIAAVAAALALVLGAAVATAGAASAKPLRAEQATTMGPATAGH